MVVWKIVFIFEVSNNNNLEIMKNSFTIIKSDLSKEVKDAAEMLVDIYVNQKGSSVKKAIKQLRVDIQEFGFNISESDLQDACAFHNVLNEYASTI